MKNYHLLLILSTIVAELAYPVSANTKNTEAQSKKVVSTEDITVQTLKGTRLNEVENFIRNTKDLQVEKEKYLSAPPETTSTNNPLKQAQAGTTETQPIVQPRVGASFTTEGAGTDQLAGFEGFIPLLQTPGQNLTYLQGRLLLSTDNSALGGNLLLGHRFLSDSKNYLVGGYFSYDTRNTGDAVFNQLGAGLEALSESLDFRTNFYLPINNTSALLSQQILGTASFKRNSLALDTLNLSQEAFAGFDAELGAKLTSLGSGDLRGYAGLYYYTSDNTPGFVGARGRLVARPNDSLVAGLTLQSDGHFDTKLIFNLGVSLPGSGYTGRSNKQPYALARLGESAERQSSITVDNLIVRDTIAAIDANTGIPLTFQHVNLGLGNSNGRIESPFGTVDEALDAAKPGDIVYVRTGTNPGIPSFTIPQGVKVISSALPQVFRTQIGNIQLPGSGSLVRPTITGTVIVSDNTALDGFAIANSPAQGILGERISNVSITNNTITNSKLTAIRLDEVTGKVNILGNTIDKTGVDSAGNYTDGIAISNSTGRSELLIERNTIKNVTATGISINTFGNASVDSLKILNNQSTGNGTGIFIDAGDTSLVNTTISDNIVSNNRFGGIVALFSNRSSNTTITNNKVENSVNPQSDPPGIYVEYLKNSTGNTTISNNTVSGSAGGINFKTYGNANATATISDNIVTKNSGLNLTRGLPVAALFAGAYDNSQANATIRNNTVTNNLLGISASANDSGKLTALVESNTVTNNEQGGIVVSSSLQPTITSTDQNGNPTGVLPQNPRTNVSLRNNTVTGSTPPPTGFGDVVAASFNNNANLCLQARGNRAGTFVLGDKPIPALFDPTPTKILSRLGGTVAIEGGINALSTTNTINMVVTAIDPRFPNIWKGASVPAGSCGFGN